MNNVQLVIRQEMPDAMDHYHRGAPSNKPLQLTIPPQGHRSIIEGPERAAGPQVIGKAFDRRTQLGMLVDVG